MRVVFMGTPDFAVASLAALLDASAELGIEVVGVVTATDKWGGRGGKQLLESEVKRYAVAHGLPVLQPEKLRHPDFLAELAELRADLQIVVAFRMLPEVVWAMPRLGTFNLHGSLLPKYRGAAPINWAIINGEKETGVTTFFLTHEIDTGSIVLQTRTPIGEAETFGELYDRLKTIGSEAVVETVRRIQTNTATAHPQNDTLATPAPKLFTETCQINFAQPTARIYDFIRGLSPSPTAWTRLDGQVLKVYGAVKEPFSDDETAPKMEIGSIVSDQKTFLKVVTEDGFLVLTDVQLHGRKRLSIRDFLNGYTPKSEKIG